MALVTFIIKLLLWLAATVAIQLYLLWILLVEVYFTLLRFLRLIK